MTPLFWRFYKLRLDDNAMLKHHLQSDERIKIFIRLAVQEGLWNLLKGLKAKGNITQLDGYTFKVKGKSIVDIIPTLKDDAVLQGIFPHLFSVENITQLDNQSFVLPSIRNAHSQQSLSRCYLEFKGKSQMLNRIDSTQAQKHYASLPSMKLRGRIEQAAIQGAVLGGCNILVQVGVKRGHISQKATGGLSLVMYGTILYALNFYLHYNAYREVAGKCEPIAYTVAVEAAIDTAQVMAVYILSVSCQKASNYFENKGRRWSAGFFKCAEKVSRYALPLVGALKESSWASRGYYLTEAVAQIGAGISAQIATEEVGKRILFPRP